MKKILLTLAAVVCILACACSKQGPRKVEKPYVAAQISNQLFAEAVELTDTATIVTFRSVQRPGWWIEVDSGAVISADGRTYAMTSSSIALNEHITMGESGDTVFTLTFRPVPFETRSIDFIESPESSWKIYGIDVTGAPAAPAPRFAEGLPKEIRDLDTTAVFTEPVLEAAPAEIRLHVLGYRPEYGKVKIYTQDLAGTGEFTIVPDENGNGTVSPMLYGTTALVPVFEDSRIDGGEVLLAPGDNVDIYLDAAVIGDNNLAVTRSDEFPDLDHINRIFDNGRYAALNRVRGSHPVELNIYGNDRFDWRMTPAQFVDSLTQERDEALALVAAMDIPEAARAYLSSEVNMSALATLANARDVYRNGYYMEKMTVEGINDSIQTVPGNDEIRAFAANIDIDAPVNLIISDYSEAVPSLESPVAAEVGNYLKMFRKAKSGRLTEADAQTLEGASTPFYAQAVKLRQQQAEKELAELRKATLPVPETDGDLFDAIVAPYKGKVVLVDLWNTWCGPCRAALAANEPLKTGELSDPDIVWLYLADESSNMSTYADMIKNIKGNHMMLTADQIAAIRKRFDVDGIPYYILVDRSGKAVGHPDFRDHSKLIEGIKGAL